MNIASGLLSSSPFSQSYVPIRFGCLWGYKDGLDEAILHPDPLSDVQNVGEASSKREGEEALPLPLSWGSKRNSSNAVSRGRDNRMAIRN